MVKKKKKKQIKKRTKKEIRRIRAFKYIFVTVVLGLIVYFLTSFVTTLIMDTITKNQEEVHSIFENIETSETISIQDFVDGFNQKLQENGLSYHLDAKMQEEENRYKCLLDEENQIILYLEPKKAIQNPKKETLVMSAVFFKKEFQDKETMLSLFKVLLKSNYDKLTEEEIEKLVQNVEEANDQEEATSLFYEVKGLEVSKKIDDQFISYRVGRIMEK